MYYYQHLEGWEKFKYLWRKGAITVLFVAVVCSISLVVGMMAVAIVRLIINYLFGYESNLYILLGIIIIIYTPYCIGIAMDIISDYPPKKKINEL